MNKNNMRTPQAWREQEAYKFNPNYTTKLINFKYAAKHGSQKPLYHHGGSVSNSNYYYNSKRSDTESKSSIRERNNMSQQYQKFKITLARGMNKKHVSPILHNSKMKKHLSQKFEDTEEPQISQSEMIERINQLEVKIKETKRNLLHERELNIMLFEENENLRKTNQIIDKGILQNINETNTATFQGGENEENQK